MMQRSTCRWQGPQSRGGGALAGRKLRGRSERVRGRRAASEAARSCSMPKTGNHIGLIAMIANMAKYMRCSTSWFGAIVATLEGRMSRGGGGVWYASGRRRAGRPAACCCRGGSSVNVVIGRVAARVFGERIGMDGFALARAWLGIGAARKGLVIAREAAATWSRASSRGTTTRRSSQVPGCSASRFQMPVSGSWLSLGINASRSTAWVRPRDANSFRKSEGQLMADSSVKLRRMGGRNSYERKRELWR